MQIMSNPNRGRGGASSSAVWRGGHTNNNGASEHGQIDEHINHGPPRGGMGFMPRGRGFRGGRGGFVPANGFRGRGGGGDRGGGGFRGRGRGVPPMTTPSS